MGTVEVLPEDSKYLNIEYYSIFQISPSIMTLHSNGGEREGFELYKAFDNNWNTHWRSEGEQGESYTNPKTGITYESLVNNIIITFNSTVLIDKMVYKTDNCNGCEGIGYPLELKIYSKLKSNSIEELDPYDESGFILIDDIVSDATQNKVLFQFNQTIKCDQIKIEWGNMKTYYPRFPKMTTAREIIFFFPETEYLNETILNLFSKNDYTQMTINEEFDLETIERIIENSQEILNFNEEINNILKRAKLAVIGGLIFDEKREFTTNQTATRNIIHQRGDIASFARNTLKMAMAGTNRQSMGIYGLPGEKITFYVTANDNDPLPRIRFTQYIGDYYNWLGTEISLVKGKQSYKFDNFTVSTLSIKTKAGGPLYISNPYTSEQQSQNVKIYIEGGTIFPTYRLGENEEEYKEFLSEYIAIYNNNPDKFLDMTELFGFRTMITVQATLAYNIYKDKTKGPLSNLNTWDEYIKKLFMYDGIQYEPSEPNFNIKNTYVNLHIRYAQPFGAAYAGYEHIGIFSEGWFNTAIYAQAFGWGFAHEIGHTMDINERTVSENSNNMISKYDDAYLRRDGTRGEFANSLKYLTPDDIDVYERGCSSDTCNGFFTNMQLNFLVWWYLESLYPGYWGKLDNMYRYNYSLSTGMSRTERLIFFSNIITGIDLGYYFYRWGFFLNNEGIFIPNNASQVYQTAMDEYIGNKTIDNTTQPKYWYLDYKEYLYIKEGGEGCYEDKNKYDIQIKKVFYINTDKTILLLPEINCEGHLGFEIYEHNKLIGFTYGYSYVDTNTYNSDYIQEYKIIAIDRKLIPSKESDSKEKKIDSQVCIFNSEFYNSIKEAVEYAESLDEQEELNIYLLKDTYESTIYINKEINIYLSENIENTKIYRIDDGALFYINEGGKLKIEGRSENNKIILDGLNISHRGNLIYSYKGTFIGNYLSFQNNINSDNNGGAIWGQSSSIQISNSLVYNNYAAYGGGYNGQIPSGAMTAIFTNVIFDKNNATDGGSLKNTGKLSLINSTVKNSYAYRNGGAICNDGGGEFIITNGEILNNIADGKGGGLYLDGFSTLTDSEISGNSANYGGGITFSGGNNRRIGNINSGTIIRNNNANYYGGGLFMEMGILNLNSAEIYDNKIGKLDGFVSTNHSDIFLMLNGEMYINGAKFHGCIFKSDSAKIYLNSQFFKYKEDSNIYIDFVNDGNDKSLLTGKNYLITSDDLNLLNLIDSNEGTLSLSSDSIGNSVKFAPKLLNISFGFSGTKYLFTSFLEEDDKNNEIFYYGKEIILSEDLFPLKENEYIIRLYDDKGNNYDIGQTLKLVDNLQFFYDIGYKNRIILDFMDYKEEKLLIPNEILSLPSIRTDNAYDKLILSWENKETGETFKKYEKVKADKNKTLVAIYDSKYYPIRILLLNNKEISEIIKFGNNLIIPNLEIPTDIHLIGWKDQLSNEEFNNQTKTIYIEKEYFLKGIYVGYVNYFIDAILVYQKAYEINTTFAFPNISEFSDKKILYWKDNYNNRYNSSEEYYMQHDINLYAIIEDNKDNTSPKKSSESEKSNSAVIAIIVIIIIVVVIIAALLIYRYFRRKNYTNKIEEKSPKKNNVEQNLNSLNDI